MPTRTRRKKTTSQPAPMRRDRLTGVEDFMDTITEVLGDLARRVHTLESQDRGGTSIDPSRIEELERRVLELEEQSKGRKGQDGNSPSTPSVA